MKKSVLIVMSFLCLLTINAVEYNEIYDLSGIKAAVEIKNLIQNDLLKWINDDTIIQAVNTANKKNASRTLDQIKALDKEWINTKEPTSFMKEFTTNRASLFLIDKMNKSQMLFAEIFITDFQGCIVAETGITSDFWQGDEDKFIKTYGAGGKIFIDKIKYDESTKTSSMQISLPLYDMKSKNMVGSITITLDMDKRSLLKKK